MSNLNSNIEDLRDQIASAQSTIDQARAHFAANSDLLTDAMREHFNRELDERQAILDFQKTILEREFPK